MKKTLILASFLALASFAKGQLLLEALEGGIAFTPSEKCLELVKDKYYGDGVHNFVYCAVQGPNGKKWLNLNLGAEYAREGSEYFNPEAVPTDIDDWKAFGSLFQYGRDADGHELVTYMKNTERSNYWLVKFMNGTISQGNLKDTPNNQYWSNWYAVDNLFERWYDTGTSNPCPSGYNIVSPDRMIEFFNTAILSPASGQLSTPSIIRNKNPYLTLVTSPVVWEPLDAFSDLPGYHSTMTTSKETENHSGTSGIWVRFRQNDFMLKAPIVRMDGSVSPDAQYRQSWMFGYMDYGISNMFSPRVQYAMSEDEAHMVPEAAAIRCVEQ